MPKGEKILKYGAVIGSLTQPVAAGDHIHTHNLDSDYTPTYTLEEGHTIGDPQGCALPQGHAYGPAEPAPWHPDGETVVCVKCVSHFGELRCTMKTTAPALSGYPRADGRKGIRNVIVVAYLVECAHHVAREITLDFRHLEGDVQVHLVGFPGCFPNSYAERMMTAIATHPNVGAALLVSLGCESMNKRKLEQAIADSGRPVATLTIHNAAARAAPCRGVAWVRETAAALARQTRVPMALSELVVGTICGGSDGTSGISANPAVGRAFDMLIEDDATCIFEETGELVGCEFHMKRRAATPELGEEIVACVNKAARYYSIMGHGSFAPGNADGGLSTIEEKSLGAYAKRRLAHSRHHQAGRRAALRRPVPAGRGARRRTALRLSQHQRQRRDRRADRLRLA